MYICIYVYVYVCISSALCYIQMVNTNTLRSNQAKRVFSIYHIITCKSYGLSTY